MSNADNNRKGFYGWIGNTVEKHSTWLIAGTIVLTALLFIPFFTMTPKERATDNPASSEIVELQDHIEDTFPTEVHVLPFIIEANDGDILTQQCLYELYKNDQELKNSELADFLDIRFMETAGATIEGVYSLADAVNIALLLQSEGDNDLSSATELEVKQTLSILFDDPDTMELRNRLSVKSEMGENGWTSPAFLFIVLANSDKVKEEYAAIVGEEYTGEIALEHYGRAVLNILRGEKQIYQIWGIGIDIELEIEDEARYVIPMTAIALFLIGVLLSIIFHSAIITLITIIGLAMIIVWLKGFSNLIGLNSSTALDLIVPIAIIVLGVDYAIQALFRYREERDKGKLPKEALGSSTYGVGRALMLAMATTVIAFSSNAASGIESVIGFGIGASFAMFASLIILGLFVPAVIMQYHSWRSHKATVAVEITKVPSRGAWLGNIVSGVSHKWFISLPLILIITGASIWGWTNIETKMEVEEALDANSDFVVGINKIDEHMAETVGEPANLYVEGDLSQHEALYAILNTIEEMNDNQHVARLDGKPNAHVFLFDMLAAVINEDYTREQIRTASGIEITDEDDDFIPDTQEQLQTVYDHVTINGIWKDETSPVYRPRHIAESFVHESSEIEKDATNFWIGVPGTQEQEIAKASFMELQEDMDIAMGSISSIDSYGLTGDAYVRVEQFDAISDSFAKSLSIAAVAVLLLLLVVFRSLRYAIITMVPVFLVACWLYGFMYVAGYHLNIMTAMIAALSIGIGIDFSIHYTERFRQEWALTGDKRASIREAARTTGYALFSAALTTIVGFVVITFAPMPMFATFGVLTAIMIALSLLMALFALPSLLLLFIPEDDNSK